MSDTVSATIVEKWQAARDIHAFTLAVERPDAIGAAAPGAHIDVHLPSGAVRQYSLTGLSRDDPGRVTIAVLREEGGRGGSIEMCDTLSVGDRVPISPARNTFALDHGRPDYRLLAGGIGLTPILHMAFALHDAGRSFQLDICTRSPADVAFKTVIDATLFADRIRYHHSAEAGNQRLDLPAYLAAIPPDTQLYACGPARMMDEIDRCTRDWGAERLRTERFSNEVADLSDEDSGVFTIELARSGRSFEIPEDKSILDVLNAEGISKDSSCLEGVCGTCITEVVSGDIIHRDACLYDEEKEANSAIACCVSRGRPGTTVVLDL
ncbi:oxidoreductase [Parasphingopyxis algicola]|uniref:PDR/VanB family oxidoreductase n=1 Tax=Parasphingopyxis algicola TaxID=2026624 RepID=UPI0015A0A31D|nr:PDR/VanB family oxidoreductase [Parasphingopyxis algicola]QLC26420.1 oxidoreductase [Parasphingopyxis algicola]